MWSFDSPFYIVIHPLPPPSCSRSPPPFSLFPFILYHLSLTPPTHMHTHTQLIEALESFVSGTRTRLRKMMMKKREKEAMTYVNVKPRNASMAVEVSHCLCINFSLKHCVRVAQKQ